MKKMVKSIGCVLLAAMMCFSFSSCSKTVEITEENITSTVEIVETALKEYDEKTLKKYVNSETLNYIFKLGEKHEQFGELGKALFEDLEIEIESIDVQNQTVTVGVHNTKLTAISGQFAQNLKDNYSTMQLLKLLNDDSFLNSSLKELVDGIRASILPFDSTVTLKVEQGKRNLVLSFDEDAENAVSGGALGEIKKIYS